VVHISTIIQLLDSGLVCLWFCLDLSDVLVVVVWHNGSTVAHINVVAMCWVWLVLGWMTVSQSRKIYLGLINHPGQLSLATPLWVGANEYWRWSIGDYQGRKLRVLRFSKPCNQDCYILAESVKVLAVNRAGHPANVGGVLA